jgi:ABC-type transport system involved in multi-copper enzyme maturation permease subunit
MPALLHYRRWQGEFHSPWWSVWPITRVALTMLMRRWLFWVLYAFGLLQFLMFFFGAFLLAWAESQLTDSGVQLNVGNVGRLLGGMRRALNVLNGSQDTFQYFFAYQGAIVIVTLAFVGTFLVGNDFTFNSLGFYLAKPINRWHYLLGKMLAVALVVQAMTTLPALGLYVQHAFDDWDYLVKADYFGDGRLSGVPLLLAILAYGTFLSVFLSVILVATASWMRRTAPLIMVWMSLFTFLRLLANILVDGLKYDARFRLIDLWANLALLGQACLGYDEATAYPQPHPEFWEAGAVLAGVCVLCLIYLNYRTRAVEIVK